MKEFFKEIRLDKIIRLSMLLSTIFVFIGILLLGFFYRILPPLVPVFNQLPWGESRLGPTYFLFIPYGVIVIIGLSNIYISKRMYTSMPLIARIMSLTTFFVTILILIFTIRIVLLFI